MTGELNTEVHDDPASCRTTANWLGQVQPGVTQIGDVVHRQRSGSETFWQGTAGDACRLSLTTQGNDADEIDKLIGQVKQALNAFADAIETVRSRINDARTVASDAKLIVTPTVILPPAPVSPHAAPHQTRSGPTDNGRSAALSEHQAKKAAFEDARTTVETARDDQREAHRKLDEAMKDPLEAVKATKTYAMFAVGQGLSSIKGSYEAATNLFEKADRWNAAATTMQARAAQKPGNLRDFGNRAATHGFDKADDAARRATHASKFGGNIPERAARFISANPGDMIKGSGAVSKFGSKALRGVPFVGTAASVMSGVGDVAMGKDPWEAAEDTGANIAGGAAGGWAGAAIGTAICPGVGTVIGGVVGGIAGSMATSKGVDYATGE